MRKNPVLHFYARVGAPELVFFISLKMLFFIPFIFNINDSILHPLLYTLFAFALEYLAFSWKTKYKTTLTVIIILSIIVQWLQFFQFSISPGIVFTIEIAIYIISFYFVTKSIFFASEVDINSLLASISGYLLLGMGLGLTVFTFETMYPNHFSFSTDFTIFDSYYYSFVTMSTLGYGDIAPLNRGGKGLAILITLLGQFYMVIVMGLIIGQLLSSKKPTK